VVLHIGMSYKSLKCIRCSHVWDVRENSWEFCCPKCEYPMKRVGGWEYCICLHHLRRHSRPDTNGCWDCICHYFINVKNYEPDKDDASIFKIKTCKHEFKKTESKEGIWYQCIHCEFKTKKLA